MFQSFEKYGKLWKKSKYKTQIYFFLFSYSNKKEVHKGSNFYPSIKELLKNLNVIKVKWKMSNIKKEKKKKETILIA